MAGFFARGTMKPPVGASINPAHPLGQNLILCAPFADGMHDQTGQGAFRTFLWLPSPTAGTAPAFLTMRNDAGLGAWGSNREGVCQALSAVDSSYWTVGNINIDYSAWLPTDAFTACIVRRKRDTTNRWAALFGADVNSSTGLCAALVPYTDGTVYWDFGYNSFNAPNRLSVAGLSFSTTVPEHWVFTAGPRGSAIWQNGVKVASQATAVTRTTAVSTNFYIGSGGTSGVDNVDLNYIAFYNVQWSDALCQWWSAEPYAHLYPERARRYGFLRSVVPVVAATTVRRPHYTGGVYDA